MAKLPRRLKCMLLRTLPFMMMNRSLKRRCRRKLHFLFRPTLYLSLLLRRLDPIPICRGLLSGNRL